MEMVLNYCAACTHRDQPTMTVGFFWNKKIDLLVKNHALLLHLHKDDRLQRRTAPSRMSGREGRARALVTIICRELSIHLKRTDVYSSLGLARASVS